MKKDKVAKANTKQEEIDFRNEGIADVQFSSGMVKMSGLYRVHLTWQKCLLAAALGLFFSIATIFFIQNTGLYSGGSTAICQGIARVVNTVLKVNNTNKTLVLLVYNLLFWGLYLFFNVFLLIFYIKTMNKEFVYLSAIYICVSQLTGIGLGMVPGLIDIQIFGSTSTVNSVLKDANVECIVFYPNIFPTYNFDSGEYIWLRQITDTGSIGQLIKTEITNENLTKSFSLLVYAITYSIIYSLCNAGIYILGGSSMGTESLAMYISEKKNKEVGSMLKVIQASCLVCGVILGSYVSGIVAGSHYVKNPPAEAISAGGVQASTGTYASWQYIFNANLVASLLYIFINGALINSLFPTRKLVRVEIFTQQAKGVLDNLRKHKYPHPTTVVNSFGGYSGATNNIVVTVLPIMALTNYINSIREIDKTCLIAVTTLDDCVGRIGLEKHTNLKASYDRRKAEAKAAANTAKQLEDRIDIKEPITPKKKKVTKKK